MPDILLPPMIVASGETIIGYSKKKAPPIGKAISDILRAVASHNNLVSLHLMLGFRCYGNPFGRHKYE